MSEYLTSTEEFCDRSVMTTAEAVELDAKEPGWLARQRVATSAFVDVRLAVRGDVPFTGDIPEIIKKICAWLITPEAYDKLGWKPSDERQAHVTAAEERAYAWLAEAADPVKGLLFIPKQQGLTPLQTEQPLTLASSEQSPFTDKHRRWDAVQRNRRYA